MREPRVPAGATAAARRAGASVLVRGRAHRVEFGSVLGEEDGLQVVLDRGQSGEVVGGLAEVVVRDRDFDPGRMFFPMTPPSTTR